MNFPRLCRRRTCAGVIICLLPFASAQATDEKALRIAADSIVEKAIAAADPVTALDDRVDLANLRLIKALANALERVRKKHVPPKTLSFSSRLIEAARAHLP